MQFTPELRQKIIDKLQQVGVSQPCPRCKNMHFTIVDGFFMQPLQNDIEGALILSGPSVPSILIICTVCGYMSQHALGVLLGFLPKNTANEVTNGQK